MLDGGLATQLEAAGHDLSGRLWSARLLRDAPEAIEQAHLTYFRAGAEVAITASYQASEEGLAAAGFNPGEAADMIRRSVALAQSARARFVAEAPQARRPVVAGSIGPYGAMLADGSEYRGDYAVSPVRLAAFHRPRIAALLEAGADMLALETIPSVVEARVLAQLLAEFPGVVAWLSFSCCDGVSISDGTRFADAVRTAEASPGIVAVGVNCTAPEHVEALLGGAHGATRLPFVVYPNDGRTWDASRRVWSGGGVEGFSRSAVDRWRRLGATMIGGCCGVGPATISRLAAAVGRARIEERVEARYT